MKLLFTDYMRTYIQFNPDNSGSTSLVIVVAVIVLVLVALLISLISSIKFLHISWFKSSEEVDNIRKGIENLCPRPGSDILSRGTEEQFSLVIYQRNLNRRFKHLSYIVNAINSNISSFLRGNQSRRRWQVLISIAPYVCIYYTMFLTYIRST